MLEINSETYNCWYYNTFCCFSAENVGLCFTNPETHTLILVNVGGEDDTPTIPDSRVKYQFGYCWKGILHA